MVGSGVKAFKPRKVQGFMIAEVLHLSISMSICRAVACVQDSWKLGSSQSGGYLEGLGIQGHHVSDKKCVCVINECVRV